MISKLSMRRIPTIKMCTATASLLTLLLALFLIPPSAVQAQQTVSSLLESCAPPAADRIEDRLKNLICMGYLTGLFDAFRLSSDMIGRKLPPKQLLKWRICSPKEGVANEELISIAIKGLQKEKDKSLPARTAAFAAWHEAYPCP